MLDQHFPEKKWHYKQSGLWAAVSLLGLFAAGCLAGVILLPDVAARVIFGILGLFFLLGVTLVWRRHRHGEFTLTAEGVSYTGWTRPLRFQEVEKIFARRSYSNVILSFRLKEKEPPIWKGSLLRTRTRGVTFSLSGLNEKPLTIAQTVFRYMTRQTEPIPAERKPAKAN
jgi:hypothetical protein